MSDGSRIEWTDCTWNPTVGCTKVSEGCLNCYAEKMAKRLQAMGQAKYSYGFAVRPCPDALNLPVTWKRGRRVFVNSMGDLFHRQIDTQYVSKVIEIMRACPQHVFQVLTKRPERMIDIKGWPSNVMLGTTCEHHATLGRFALIRGVFQSSNATFISAEPLLGPIDTTVFDAWHETSKATGLKTLPDWVIVGGENGPGARPMQPEWVYEIRDACVKRGIPFFFKGWGTAHGLKGDANRQLDGEFWEQMPECCQEIVNARKSRSCNHG